MVRNYKRKHTPGYSDQDLIAAVDSVKEGSGIRYAARKWNVPFETLRARLEGIYGTQRGRPTQLTKEEWLCY